MAHIVALVSDPELAAAGEAAGHAVDVCTSEADAWDACEEYTELLVVDLSGEAVDGATLVDSMRAGGELRKVHTLALHRDADRGAIARAQEVGLDAVVARTRAHADAAELITRLLARAGLRSPVTSRRRPPARDARVEELAAAHPIAPRTLQRLFQRYVGVSPKWVLKRLRIHQAVQRLGEPLAVPWTTLALELGYYDHAHFIRDFRRVVGRSPADHASEMKLAQST